MRKLILLFILLLASAVLAEIDIQIEGQKVLIQNIGSDVYTDPVSIKLVSKDKELNIERKLRKEVSSLLFTEDGDEEIVSSSNTLSILPHNLFANCQKAVFTNMNDTHARFIRSTVYLEYIKKIQKK